MLQKSCKSVKQHIIKGYKKVTKNLTNDCTPHIITSDIKKLQSSYNYNYNVAGGYNGKSGNEVS